MESEENTVQMNKIYYLYILHVENNEQVQNTVHRSY